MNDKNRGTLYYLLVLSIITILFIVIGVSYFKKKPEANGDTSTKSADEVKTETNNDQDSKIENLSIDQKLYAQAILKLEAKDYQAAIDYLAQAIAENPNVVSYYSLKSEAEYLVGKKDDAKATLEAGLKIDPGNELLNSKLDVLTKEYFQSSSFEATRE